MASEASEVLRQVAPRKHGGAAAHGHVAAARGATAKKGQGDAVQEKIVITEMEEFVLGLQPNGETRRQETQDVFTDEDGDATSSGTIAKAGTRGLALRQEEGGIEGQVKEGAVKQAAVLHEVAVGKGLAGALKFLQDRGTLNEGEGETTDKKKSKVVGFKDGPKEIRIQRTDEFGRVSDRNDERASNSTKKVNSVEDVDSLNAKMTMKEAFRELSHKFHGKGPGKAKQEKRQRKYQEELKAKRMKSSDTPLMSAEKMREAQARSRTPYIVLSGSAKSR